MTKEKRFDIQVLRGVAVLAVVIYHALPAILPKGYLGVDVFFVISGYLICGMILARLESNTFGFIAFYARRARRLLPASLVTLAVTTIVSVFVLTPTELRSYVMQLLGALTFTANIVLSGESGYFDAAADAKPLLHIWSLSLEEQFYFIAPLLLWLAPLRTRLFLLIGATCTSALLCFLLVSGISVFSLSTKAASKLAFFMLPFRAWELLIGGIAAWVMLKSPSMSMPVSIKYLAVTILLATCVVGFGSSHPGVDALIVTLSTGLILLGGPSWLIVNRMTRVFSYLGDISYSLYLVHWPLLSFAFILYVGNVPVLVLFAIALFSIILAALQYYFVEQPCQSRDLFVDRRLWPILGGAMGVLGVLSLGVTYFIKEDPEKSPVTGLSKEDCTWADDTWIDKAECRSGDNPRILLWGDSFAMHLVPGLLKSFGPAYPILQATKNACAPTIGLAQVTSGYSLPWARDCMAFNDLVALSLSDLVTIKYVVVSSRFGQVFTNSNQNLSVDSRLQGWSPIAKNHLKQTIDAIQKAGKKAIIIGPTPIANFDVGACNDRLLSRRPLMREDACVIRTADVLEIIGDINKELREVASETGALALLPSNVLCNAVTCDSTEDGHSMYRDGGHLTRFGSIKMIERFHLTKLLD